MGLGYMIPMGVRGVKEYLLDTYMGAVGAYSVRKLSSTATLCMKVRRSSDDTTLDIGFINDMVDTVSLLSFCGSGDGFVVNLYDQSGKGYNTSSPTNAAQSKIVSNGVVILGDTNIPAWETNGIDNWFSATIPEIKSAPALAILAAFSSKLAAAANTNSITLWAIGNFGPSTKRGLYRGASTSFLSGEFTIYDVRKYSSGVALRLGSSTYRLPADTINIESTLITSSELQQFQNGIKVNLDLQNGSQSPTMDYTPLADPLTTRIDFSAIDVDGVITIPTSLKYSEIIIYANDITDDIRSIENNMSVKYVFVGNQKLSYNPYSNVNFINTEQYKAGLHMHTTKSDGADTPADLAQAHSDYNFDVIAITDHDTVQNKTNRGPTFPLSAHSDFVATTIYDDSEYYEELGLLMIKGNELSSDPYGQTNSQHRNALFCDIWTSEQVTDGTYESYKSDVPWTLSKITEMGGISIINHPKWHYNKTATYYADLINESDALGIEIFNPGTNETDAYIWDDILMLVNTGKKVYGFSNSDSHNFATGLSRIGRHYNKIFASDLSETSIKTAIANGAFYAVFDDGGDSLNRHNPELTPIINSITATAKKITIDASNCSKIEWIYNNSVIAEGNIFTIPLMQKIKYVRAKLTGDDGGFAFTNPFNIEIV